jgi:hypothetical protein
VAAHRTPVSSARLLALMRAALGRPQRLFRAAPGALEWAAALAGQRDNMRRLTRSLEVDASAVEGELGWTARVGIDEAVAEMAGAHGRAEPR